MDGENMKNVNPADQLDKHSVVSSDSEDSTMEPFDSYKLKIGQLLDSIGLIDFSIEPIQHGYGFMNCVYALTSLRNPAEQYILRVAIDGPIRDSDGKHETLDNDIVLMDYLKDKLAVPRIKAYSVTADNVLDAAYTVQTRIPGQSLDNLWATMCHADKYAIVDEFLDLLIKLESVKFATAGTFATSTPLPAKMNDFSDTEVPLICKFEPYTKDAMINSPLKRVSTGTDVKKLLKRHLESWIQEEVDRGQHETLCAISPRFGKLLTMLEEMEEEGYFEQQPSSVVLHHWDLEPRNLMVSKTSGAWKICGIIDWDDAVALPKPLARIPPRWIWHYPDEEPELEDGFLNDDQYSDPELSDENKALKAYFDAKIEALLPGYIEDAYGGGRWLRRIWHFAKEGAFRTWQWDFLDQLPKDWEARQTPKPRVHHGTLHWIQAAVRGTRTAIFGKLRRSV